MARRVHKWYRERNAAVYTIEDGHRMGMVVLYANPDVANDPCPWVAEAFVAGGSETIVRGFSRFATLMRAKLAVYQELDRRAQEVS